MQATAINGHPRNARKYQGERAYVMIRRCAIILCTFSEVLPDFGVSFCFWIKFDFFRNNPDRWVLILIFINDIVECYLQGSCFLFFFSRI